MSKTLLITGASKGIGLATAKHFSHAGYDVVNVSRSPCTVDGAKNIAIDLLQADWLKNFAAPILSAVGEPEELVLVHNAAIMTKETVSDVEAQSLRNVLELNVVAAAQLNTLLICLLYTSPSPRDS